jgi:hypothetical protein
MIPFLLAALGGYLIGQSRRDEQYAKGGDIKRPKPIELVLKGKKTGVKGFNFVVYNLNGKDYALVTPIKGEQFVDDYPTKTGKWRKPVFKDGGMMDDGGMMAEGGSIPNNYKGKNEKEVWDNWSIEQREHFVSDHYGQWNGSWSRDIQSLPKLSFEKVIKKVPHFESALYRHISEGQYASGGYMAKGGVLEHGLRKGDKIVSEMYNIAGVINEDSGEAALVDIETGKREEIK